MKYFIIRFLDVVGLKVLEPIVRLICGEDPLVQIKKIGLFICVPILTFMGFIAIWSYVGPRHKTKSGEVPGPGRVIEAWDGIVQFASRENQKKEDFRLAGPKREQALRRVQAESKQIAKYSKLSTARFKQLETLKQEALSKQLAPYLNALAMKEQEYQANADAREAALLAKAADITPDDRKAKSAYLTLINQHLAVGKEENEHLRAMRSELDVLRQEKWPVLEEERRRKNALDQSRQFLVKRESFLSSANRSIKVASLSENMKADKLAFLTSTSPTKMLDIGTKLVKADERLRKIESSEYAQPPTFFMQLRMSLACVFVGFMIATAIAIPIGVLCGLSDIFMAAMSPLISLFKPVSPIVWLPIVFIIIGGFQMPEIKGQLGWLATPSFLASAVTVALCSLWPTLVNTALGVASIDKDHVNVARVLQLGFWNRLFKIVIPSALPLIFAGLRISLGVGWMVLIAAELLSSSPGLGKYVWDMFNNGSSETFAQMFVVVFVVGLVGLLLDRIMIVFQRLVSFDGAATAL